MHYSEVFNSHVLTPELADIVRRMPKIELHVHLEGSTDPQTTYEMARRNQVDLPVSTLSEWQAWYVFKDFNHFIDVYVLATSVMKQPEDYVAMVESYMRTQAEQNIVYSEVYLSTSLHRNKFSIETILDALSTGIDHGTRRYGTSIKLIPDISRHLASEDIEAQEYVLEFALQAKERGIGIGMGIGGKEIGHEPEKFTHIFAQAKEKGLRVVAHAGETDGAKSVAGALDALKAERIGHGVRAIEDNQLLEKLRTSRIPLEVSPQSNYCLGVVARDTHHPIRTLVDAGVICTVNTDDPPFFSTDLTNEYLTLAAQGFSLDELWQLNRNALDAAFLSDDERRIYQKTFDEFEATIPGL